VSWPDLDYGSWRDTAQTLHLMTQIVGKVRLALTPWVNHSWQVPLYVTARGLGTSPIPWRAEIFEIDFDFLEHGLTIRTGDGRQRKVALAPQPIADFYARFLDRIESLGIKFPFRDMPSEIADAIPFSVDRVHESYDAEAAHRFWRALVRADHVFKFFRSSFLGKVSPVHFFWGSFDLAVTRFSGRRAPRHPGGVPGLPDAVAREAYSHEVSSAGFWPGNDAFPMAVFYSYAWPEPAGFRERPVTVGAHFEPALGEFILPYETVRSSADPDALLLDFLSTTYAAAADSAAWDRAALECDFGVPGKVRRV